MNTTLKQIEDFKPCPDGWKKLLKYLGKDKADDEPLSFHTILKCNGLSDACWALRTISGFDKEKRLLACDLSELAVPIVHEQFSDRERPLKQIEASRQYAWGNITLEELRKVRNDKNDLVYTSDNADLAMIYLRSLDLGDACKHTMDETFLKYFG